MKLTTIRCEHNNIGDLSIKAASWDDINFRNEEVYHKDHDLFFCKFPVFFKYFFINISRNPWQTC